MAGECSAPAGAALHWLVAPFKRRAPARKEGLMRLRRRVGICGIVLMLAAGLLPAQALNPVPVLGGGTFGGCDGALIWGATFAPAWVTAGDYGVLTLRVFGGGFISSSVVRWNGSDRPTTFACSVELRASIPASDTAVAGVARITVYNPPPGGGVSTPATYTVNNPAPAITSLVPSSATAGAAGFTLAVYGSGFLTSSVVNWNGSSRPTTFVSIGQLNASIGAADIATAGTAQVTVFHPPPGGGTATANFTVGNPKPALTSLSPSSITASSAGFTLTVTGSSFVSSSVVRWKRSDRPTTFVSSTQLQAAIPASDIATAGTADITVSNPSPGGGESSAVTFTINNPLPTLTSLSPSTAIAGGSSFTLTVGGSGFVSNSVVRWNGSDRSTTFVSSTQMRAAIGSGDIRDVGDNVVMVFNPTPGGGTSNPVLFSVGTNRPTLSVSPEFLDFSATEGAPSPSSRAVSITNVGSGTLQWAAEAKTSSGNWLKISPTFGNAPSFLLVTADSTGLSAGVYTGVVTLRDTSGASKTVAVTLVVSRVVPLLQPSQAGFLFQGIEGGASIPTQTFQVLNLGQGSMGWQVRATTADGRNWLSVTPGSGTSQPGSAGASSVTVRVDPSQLRAGVYVGLLNFEASGAPNSPQVGIVLVNILAPGNDPLGVVQPAGLIFIGTAGAASPAPQDVTLASTGGKAIQFVASARTASAGNWLAVTPAAGPLTDSAALRVQVNTTGLAAGIYTGTVTVALSTGKGQDVAVALVLTSTPAAAIALASTAAFDGGVRPVGGCTAGKLALVETLLADNFTLSVGWPAAMRTQVIDDCGQLVSTATVVASFTNGDPALVLTSLKDGRYIGTWVPTKEGQQVGITVRALAAGLAEAKIQMQGVVGAAAGTLPQAFRNGLVHAASYAKFAPLAPGSIFSLFGRNLATSTSAASGVPLPKELGDARVTLGGVAVPLFYAGAGQVNGQVPFELTSGAKPSVVVTVKGVAAPPDEITLAEVQPGIFTVDQSGSGQGAILDASYKLVSPASPAKAGDIVQVFCTGLGRTDPPVTSGAASPSSPAATVVNAVTATIAGINAPVQFAGLAPGFVGLYQVNVQVPAGVAAGSALPLVLTQAGVSSNTVTLAIR